MNLRHLMRMSRWARNPPSEKRVRFVLVIIALCLLIAGVEWLGYWPDWAQTQPLKP